MYNLNNSGSSLIASRPQVSRWARHAIQRKASRRAEALTAEEVEIIAPSVFADRAHEEVSNRYQQIDTHQILKGLDSEGWKPVWASEQIVRKKSRAGFQKHMLRFRHVDTLGKSNDLGSTFPEIVLVNSHDRSSSFQIHAGLFRLVCSNGLVLADSTFERLRVIHTADSDAVIEAALKVPANVPQIMDRVESMSGRVLSVNAQEAFAESAAILRFGSLEEAPIEPQKLLGVRRQGDIGNDAWKVFNRIQENTIRGGQRYIKRTEKGVSRSRVREVKGLDQSTNLNKALWHLSERMAELTK